MAFRSRINRHLLTVGSFWTDFVYALIFFVFLLFVTPCLVVAVRRCMEWIPIKKKKNPREGRHYLISFILTKQGVILTVLLTFINLKTEILWRSQCLKFLIFNVLKAYFGYGLGFDKTTTLDKSLSSTILINSVCRFLDNSQHYVVSKNNKSNIFLYQLVDCPNTNFRPLNLLNLTSKLSWVPRTWSISLMGF